MPTDELWRMMQFFNLENWMTGEKTHYAADEAPALCEELPLECEYEIIED